MKLYEMFGPISQVTKRNSGSAVNTYRRNQTRKLGSGGYAQVLKPETHKRQNEIIKVTNDRPEMFEDPYEMYISEVQNFKGQNPYLPRVHSFKSYRNKNGKMHAVFKLERLYPFMNEKIYNEEFILPTLDHMFHEYPTNAGEIPDFIEKQFKQAFYGKTQNIKDPDLKEACDLIYGIIKNSYSDITVDPHPGNFMWRITGNRPQLVITDPLSSREY